MATYNITNRSSGHNLGNFEADSMELALEELAKDAGYASYDAMCEVAPRTDLKVTELSDLDVAMHSQDGGFEHEGKVYTLAQPAYADGTNEEPIYRARATDARGNVYDVRWAVRPEISTLPADEWPEDESSLCEWGAPDEVRLVEEAE